MASVGEDGFECIKNCVFRDELKAFVGEGDRIFRFDRETTVSYGSVNIRLQDIGDGTIATLRFDPLESLLQSVTITHYIAKLSPAALFHQGFIVFSSRIFPTELWASRDQADLRMKGIVSQFPAIRKVNGMLERGFWVACGVAYCEHLCSPAVPKGELDAFLARISSVPGVDYKILDPLHDMRRGRDSLGISWLEDKHNDRAFQAQLTALLKCLCVEYIKNNPQDPIAELMEGGAEGLQTRLRAMSGVEQDVMCVLALALRVKMVVWGADGTKMSLECAKEIDNLPYLDLLLDNQTYHILYTTAKLQAQGYDLSTNTRQPPQQVISSPGLLRALYSTHKSPHYLKEIEEKRIASDTDLRLQLQLNETYQRLILSVFSTLESRPMGDRYFTDALCEKTSQFVLRYNRSLEQLRAKYRDMESEIAAVSFLEKEKFATNCTKAMNLCQNCGDKPGFWRFHCSHVLCKSCISELIEALRSSRIFLIRPNGEPMEYFQCPVAHCSKTVLKEEVKVIVGEEGYKRLIQESEDAMLLRLCENCHQERERSSFFIGTHCSCNICRICIVDLVLRHNSVCLCGMRIPDEVTTAVANYKMQCGFCGAAKGLLDNFTHSICGDHSLCRECLEEAAAEGRCSVCYREFGEEELGDFQMYFLKKCQLACGRVFSKEQRVKLTCRCHYCFDCAKERAKSIDLFTLCVLCRAALPEDTSKQFYALAFEILAKKDLLQRTIRAMERRAPECPICLNKIGVAAAVSLTCSHVLHKKCLTDMLANYTDQVITKPITCLVDNCGVEIDGNILSALMDPKRYSKYSEGLIKAKFNIITCPKCQLQFELEDYLEEGQSLTCPSPACKFEFCSQCAAPWGVNHDTKKCRYLEIKKQIAILEEEGKGEGKVRISQCPGCKTPYMKDDKCEHVTCANPRCRLDWCFECSALRAPILAHHNQWHRPSCRMHVKPRRADAEPRRENCPECKKLPHSERCRPPKNLKVPARFDLDEY